jgi:hypothetical protein
LRETALKNVAEDKLENEMVPAESPRCGGFVTKRSGGFKTLIALRSSSEREANE